MPAFEGRFLTGPQQRNGQSPVQYSAAILGGEITGPLLQGAVQTGRIEWTVDAASQTVQIAAHYSVLRRDGVLVQVRDRSIHPQAIKPANSAGLRTAPEIIVEGEHQDVASPLLVGVLDASGFSTGQVMLRAFRIV